MSEILARAKEIALLWKLAKLKAVLISIVTLAGAWQASTNNIKLSTMDRYDLLNTLVAMSLLWGTSMVAFVDKTAGEVAAGKIPVGNIEIPTDSKTSIVTTTETAVKTVDIPK